MNFPEGQFSVSDELRFKIKYFRRFSSFPQKFFVSNKHSTRKFYLFLPILFFFVTYLTVTCHLSHMLTRHWNFTIHITAESFFFLKLDEEYKQ